MCTNAKKLKSDGWWTVGNCDYSIPCWYLSRMSRPAADFGNFTILKQLFVFDKIAFSSATIETVYYLELDSSKKTNTISKYHWILL